MLKIFGKWQSLYIDSDCHCKRRYQKVKCRKVRIGYLKVMPKVKDNRLSKKERKTLQLMKKGATIEEAVAQSYDTDKPSSVRSLSNKLIKRQRFINLMDKAGLSDEAIVKSLVEGIHAMKPVVVGQGDVRKFKDYQARLGFLKVALKVKRYMDEDRESDKEGEPLIINAIQINNGTVRTKNRSNEPTTPTIEGELVKSEDEPDVA